MSELDLNTPPVQAKGSKLTPKKTVPIAASRIIMGPASAEVFSVRAKKGQPFVELILHLKDIEIRDDHGKDLRPTFGRIKDDGSVENPMINLFAYLASNEIPIVLEAQTAQREEEE